MRSILLKVGFWCGVVAATTAMWGLMLFHGPRIFIGILIAAFMLMIFAGFHLSKDYHG